MNRVPSTPGKPGKMMTVFPVMEKSWNFIILPNIMEKWGKPWKNGLSVIFAHDFFLLYRALLIHVHLGEILGHLGFCGVFRWQGTWGFLGWHAPGLQEGR